MLHPEVAEGLMMNVLQNAALKFNAGDHSPLYEFPANNIATLTYAQSAPLGPDGGTGHVVVFVAITEDETLAKVLEGNLKRLAEGTS